MVIQKMKKISFIFLSIIMFVCGFFIVNDRFANINSVSAEVDISPYNIVYLNNWTSHEQIGISLTFSNRMWTDGTNIYFSNVSSQYVLDISTLTWTTKTWNSFSLIDGRYVWTDGTNIYYSNGSSQYVLDISTSTWLSKTWYGFTSFNGNHIWTDGTNIYYSFSGSNYVLDVSTSTWNIKTWIGLTVFDGSYIWTDGTNVYYSSGNLQYVLDMATSTWSIKTWTGLSDLEGRYVWTDGTNIYYSNGSSQYVLDITTSTWSIKTWTGLTDFSGFSVFDKLPGVIICYSGNSTASGLWYTLDSQISSGGGNDTTTYYSFNGSSYIVYTAFTQSNLTLTNLHFDISDSANGVDIVAHLPSISFSSYNSSFNIVNFADVFPDLNISTSIDFNTSYVNYTSQSSIISSYLRVTTSNWSNSDIIGCTLSSELNIDANDSTYYYLIYTFSYFNSSNEHLVLQLVSHISATVVNSSNNNFLKDPYLLISTRTIYFRANSEIDGTYQDGYNTGYSDGQEIGYTNGYNAASVSSFNTGYNDGYTAGDSNGYNRGYGVGFSAGVADANEYSFFGLISAVIDAPINAFTSLFNFNLLGVNILNLITGLVTLVILIALLKLILGGKQYA